MAETSKFTFEVPADLRRLMDAHPEVNWTGVLRQAIRRHAEAADVAQRILEEQADPRVEAVASLAKGRVGARFRAEARRSRRRASRG